MYIFLPGFGFSDSFTGERRPLPLSNLSADSFDVFTLNHCDLILKTVYLGECK